MSDLKREIVNGRVVVGTTAWWARQPDSNKSDLRCAHGVPLNKACQACDEEYVEARR